MTDSMSKRKYAGEPHREKKQRDPGPLHLPPHKKPRRYRLIVKYERTTTETCVKEFHSHAALQEFRRRVEREIAKAKTTPPRKSWYWWGGFSSQLKMDSEVRKDFNGEPAISEELIDV